MKKIILLLSISLMSTVAIANQTSTGFCVPRGEEIIEPNAVISIEKSKVVYLAYPVPFYVRKSKDIFSNDTHQIDSVTFGPLQINLLKLLEHGNKQGQFAAYFSFIKPNIAVNGEYTYAVDSQVVDCKRN